MQELENLARITSKFSKNSTESKIHCMLANRGAMHLSLPMQRKLLLNFHRNYVYGHLEQVSRTRVYFHFQFTQLVWQTCSKCPYTLFMWKFNDSSRCLGYEWYICTTIFKHTMNSGLCRIFGKFRGNSGYIFKFLRLYVIFELIRCCVQIL